MISRNGEVYELPGIKEYALEYSLLSDALDNASINEKDYNQKLKEFHDKASEAYGNINLFFDWMKENGITHNDNTFFTKVLNVSRLKNVYELNVSHGLIFFTQPEPANFSELVERYSGIGLTKDQAESAIHIQLENVIAVDENNPLLKHLQKTNMNIYQPKTLREVVELWDSIQKPN
ncbi:hypothetical protein DC498_17655 [Terrimonas sp.]|nr:hypothetical protein DC498_17655 [Terrimonas sp.]